MTIAGLLASFAAGAGSGCLPEGVSGDRFVDYDVATMAALLGTPTTSPIVDTGFIRALINGQGRGVLGSGSPTFSSTSFQLIYDDTGTSTYTYSGFNDAFQPGTPHESGFFEVNGTNFLGGVNNGTTVPGLTGSNGTVTSWVRGDGVVVVLLGQGAALGKAVFQYQALGRTLRMCMSYTNDTASTVTLRAVRGGDPDFDAFATDNQRLTNGKQISGRGTTTNRTLAVYIPGNGYTHNVGAIINWSGVNPITSVLSGGDGANGTFDYAIYGAWNIGSVPPGGKVHVYAYYAVAVGVANAYAQLGL